MFNEKEFRERVEEIKRRIPKAFAEDPYYYFLSDEECEFYKNNILNVKKESDSKINKRFSDEELIKINKARIAVGIKPLKNE